MVDSFNSDFIFVENEEGKLQTKAKWLEGIPFSFISADYGEDVLSYFKNTSIEGSDVSTPTFGVLDYDKSVIIEDVILNEKYAEKVNANQQKMRTFTRVSYRFAMQIKMRLMQGVLSSMQ